MEENATPIYVDSRQSKNSEQTDSSSKKKEVKSAIEKMANDPTFWAMIQPSCGE